MKNLRYPLTLFASLVFVSALAFPLASPRIAPLSATPQENDNENAPAEDSVRLEVIQHSAPALGVSNASACTDGNSASTVSSCKWRMTSAVTYNINLASVPTTLKPADVVNLTAAAFGAWQNATGGAVRFARGSNCTITKAAYDGKNTVAWGPVTGTTLAVTYTWYNPRTGAVVDSDTILNNRLPWTWSRYSANTCGNPNSYDAQNILTHELGHWMGLTDAYDSSYIHNTMYGYGFKGEVKKDTLTSGDVTSLKKIYR